MKAILLIMTLTLLSSFSYAKGDAKAGEKKATTCAACHGANGISSNELWPNLKGQKAGYFVKSLKDYKAGKRQDPLMSPQSTVLSDQDMEDLAAYYSQLK